ncbi:MAG: hypothetical protein IJ227_03920 [Mogibacterium sp.]|nr:hypothetical protein [Mogibacterium sp.]
MDKGNIDYILDIFKTISGELPEQMLFRDNGDSMELRNPGSTESYPAPDLQDSGWSMISIRAAEAA